MSSSPFIRWTGLAAIFAGVFNAAGAILDANPPGYIGIIYLGATVTTLAAIAGFYQYQKDGAGIWGLAGVLAILIGNLFFFSESTVALGSSVLGLGLLLLAVGSFKAGKFPRWVPVLWVLSMLVGLPGFLYPDLRETLFILGAVTFAVGFAGAGYTMWSRSG